MRITQNIFWTLGPNGRTAGCSSIIRHGELQLKKVLLAKSSNLKILIECPETWARLTAWTVQLEHRLKSETKMEIWPNFCFTFLYQNELKSFIVTNDCSKTIVHHKQILELTFIGSIGSWNSIDKLGRQMHFSLKSNQEKAITAAVIHGKSSR